MKKKYSQVSDKVKMVGYNRMKGSKEVVDYYFIHPKWGRAYAFTRKYTRDTYNLVKSGIPVKQLLQTKSRDKMTMMLVKYTGLMMPYFMDEIGWVVA